ncbi:MAG: DNA-3-methyladenine glycosylase [Longimicrobiales bacterium]
MFGRPRPGTFDRTFFDRPAESVAPDLLGSRLVSTVDGRTATGVIVEVEAYTGPDDPASHAAARIGRTRRNASMFGPPGTAYVYLSYGVHWCLNVVTGPIGDPCAVLLRAVDPIEGLGVMAARRGREQDLASGPGRLGQAFGVTDALDAHDLSSPPLRLLPGWLIPPGSIDVSPRVGVGRARDWPLRFSVRDNVSVSRVRPLAQPPVPLEQSV